MTSPAIILSKALEPYDDPSLTRLARLAGVRPDNVKRAARGSKGRRPGINDYVRLCAVLGVDPASGASCAPWNPADLQADMLAIAVRMKRVERDHGIRAAAEHMGISISTLSRIENANPRSYECVLAACRYAKVDPRHYVAREAVTRNALRVQDKNNPAASPT